jgi:hypothetical protein
MGDRIGIPMVLNTLFNNNLERAPDSFVVRSTLVNSKLKIHQDSDDIRGLREKRLIRLCPRVEESKQVC